MAVNINIDSQVSQTITDGVTDKAPSENAVFDALALKVDKVTGKQLSTEDYTTTEKSKLAGIAAGAEVNVNADWNATSGDAQILNKPTISSSITIGTTPITSGVAGRVLFEGSGNVVQEDAGLFWDNTNKRLGIGATPNTSTRLDVRAQGALSTDIAFRVRNSADNLNIFQVNGDGNAIFSGDTTSNRFLFGDAILLSGGANVARYAGNAFIKHRFTNNGTISYFEIDPANGLISTNNGMNYLFGTTTGSKIGTATNQKLAFWNATPIVQPTTAVTASTLTSNLGVPLTDTDTFDGYTLKQVVKALRNMGILA